MMNHFRKSHSTPTVLNYKIFCPSFMQINKHNDYCIGNINYTGLYNIVLRYYK